MSSAETTRFGFIWGPLEVERTSVKRGIHIITIAPKGKRKGKSAVKVSVSEHGQIVRVFKDGKEMTVADTQPEVRP